MANIPDSPDVAAIPANRLMLTLACLLAGVVAAYVGTVLLLTFNMWWDAFGRSEGIGTFPMILVGTSAVSLFGFWFALPLTLPAALILGHLAPLLEQAVGPSELRWVQYGSGAGAGFGVMLGLGLLLGDGERAALTSLAGMFAGLAAVRTFRRFHYYSL
ncbi:MAG TPA: hypothetical protein VIT45_07535 [Allosphingosinicella sp.]